MAASRSRANANMAYPYFGITNSCDITELPMRWFVCGPCYASLMNPGGYTEAHPVKDGKFFYALIRYDDAFLSKEQVDMHFDIVDAITPERIKQSSKKVMVTQEEMVALLVRGVKEGQLTATTYSDGLVSYKYGEYGYGIYPGFGDAAYCLMFYDREVISLEDMYAHLAFIRIACEDTILLKTFFEVVVPEKMGKVNLDELNLDKLVVLYTAWSLTQTRFSGGHHVFGRNCLEAVMDNWPNIWQGFTIKNQWTEHCPHTVPFAKQTEKTLVQHAFKLTPTKEEVYPVYGTVAYDKYRLEREKLYTQVQGITVDQIMTVLQQQPTNEAKAA